MQIDISKQITALRAHLENNKRTILSAQFGDGKTTFLKEFFKRYEDELFAITIRPVNYSIAKNEDIFEYIKYDILLQLVKNNIVPEFDTQTFAEILKNDILTFDNLNKAIDFAISFSPASNTLLNVKKTIFEAFKSVNCEEIVNKYQEQSVSFSKYQKLFMSQIGNLYEQDGYTLLIKETIKSIKTPTVLVVEDLDRIDPKHLFRILNIFAAHIDQENNSNKFCFSNIILVMDYDKTGHIFHHFYGEKANYEGYMSKFIDHGIFRFSINEVAQQQLNTYLNEQCLFPDSLDFSIDQNRSFRSVIRKLSVRDIVHVLNDIEKQYYEIDYPLKSQITIHSSQPIVKFISVVRRLNDKMPEDQILNQLLGSDVIINMLGAYLFVCPAIQIGALFTFNNQNWQLEKNETFSTTFKARPGFFHSDLNIQHEIKKAYNECLKFVLP